MLELKRHQNFVFVHGSQAYDGNSLTQGPLGGTETVVIQLAEELARRGNRVSVVTSIAEGKNINGVDWVPFKPKIPLYGDVIVAVSNANNLMLIPGQKRAVWIHNTRTFDRFLRKGGAIATFFYRPTAVLLGSYHDSQVSKLIPYSRRIIIPHAAAAPFVDLPPRTSAPIPSAPRAIHFSQPYRDAENLITLWLRQIHPALPSAEFHIFGGDWKPSGISHEKLESAGVRLRPRLSKRELAQEIAKARVMLYRGHRDETYCLAAADAIVSGLPVVTLGIGALKERVIDGETGFIARNDCDFSRAALRLLSDDRLWLEMQKNCLETRHQQTWSEVAYKWEKAFLD